MLGAHNLNGTRFCSRRYLVKSWGQALKGANLVPTVSYLRKAAQNPQQKPKWDGSITGIIQSLQHVAAK